MSVSAPDPFYYLTNFERAVEWICTRYADLLSEDEWSFARGFGELPQSSRALLVRLLMRVGALFRQRKVQYAEIADVEAAVESLLQLGWVDADPEVGATQIAALLPKDRLMQWSLRRRATKAELSDEFGLRHGDERRRASQWQYLADEPLIAVSIASIAERFRILFFGNFHQEWKEFVLVDLGIFTYESVQFDDAARAFHCRQDIEDFYALNYAREAFRNGLPADEVLALVPKNLINHRWLDRKRAKLLFLIAREQERSGQLEFALSLYERLRCSGARFRYVRTLERLNRPEDALAAADATDASPADVAMLERARWRIAAKLGRGARRPRAPEINTMILFVEQWERVEVSAAQSLSKPNAPVYYVENALFNALFGLLYWEAIFAPVPGAFFHPFQRGPADLWSEDFQVARSDLIAEATNLLDRHEHEPVILSRYELKQGVMNPFVSWHVSSEQLALAMRCIPTAHLKAIFDRMWSDLAGNTSGFPDLIQFDLDRQSYHLIEVKGPGDRLQDHQRGWLQYFSEKGIPASVCRVRQRATV